MEDVSDIFKRGFLALHRDHGQARLGRKELHKNVRREKRSTLADLNRHISKNMTPINTPEPQGRRRLEKHENKELGGKGNKRLEMLMKWKAEKEKRKLEEQLKKKPLFKVCHVPVEIGLPNLGAVNKVIKGKPIQEPRTRSKKIQTPAQKENEYHNRKTPAKFTMQPYNNKVFSKQNDRHTGKQQSSTDSLVKLKENNRKTPNRGLRSRDKSAKDTMVETKSIGTAESKVITRNKGLIPHSIDVQGASKASVTGKINEKKKNIEKTPTRRNNKIQTPRNIVKMERKLTTENTEVQKPVTQNKNNKKLKASVAIPKRDTKENDPVEVNEEEIITVGNKRKSSRATPKKVVGWDVTENGIDLSTKEAKNKYRKTPVKLRNINSNQISDIEPDGLENDIENPRSRINAISDEKKDITVTPKTKKNSSEASGYLESNADDISSSSAIYLAKKRKKTYTKTPVKVRDTNTDQTSDAELGGLDSDKDNQISQINMSSGEEDKKYITKIPTMKKNLRASVNAGDTSSNSAIYLAKKSKRSYKKTPVRVRNINADQTSDAELGGLDSDKDNQRSQINIMSSDEEDKRDITKTPETEKSFTRASSNLKLNSVNVHDETSYSATSLAKETKRNQKTPVKVRNIKTDQTSDDAELGGRDNDKDNQRSPINIISSDEEDKKDITKTPEGKKKFVRASSNLKLNSVNAEDKSVSSGISADCSVSPDYPVCFSDTDSNSVQTPSKTKENTSQIYISPFVTISRGKRNARKEYEIRHSHGGSLPETPDFSKEVSSYTSPKAGAEYFSKKLNAEIKRIECLCDDWQKHKESPEVPEDAHDMIDVAIGQSKLLISKKFQQFRNLINQCKTSEYKEKPVTCEDLHGFWDMIYMQVEDLDKRFNGLTNLKNNNWEEIVQTKVVSRRRKTYNRASKITANSKLKDIIRAARKNKPQPQVSEEQHYTSSGTTRRSLRVSVLTNEGKKRCSSSPGLTMMKVTQSIKRNSGLTPKKSILKTDLSQSAKKFTKSVLFKESLEDIEGGKTKTVLFSEDVNESDKENCVKAPEINKFCEISLDDDVFVPNVSDCNLIEFSPVTPTRKSLRLRNHSKA